MWKLAAQLLIGLAAGASALAQEPAVSEPRPDDRSAAAGDERLVDHEAAAALLSDLFDADAALSASAGAGLTAEDLAAMLRDYAGCEVIADALMSDLTRPAVEAPAQSSPAAPAEGPR